MKQDKPKNGSFAVRHLLSLLLLLPVMLLTGCSASEPSQTYRQVSADEAIALMETQTDYIILDVRTRAEYEEKHIPGAVCIPNESIGTEEIPELPDKDQLILVYCRSGRRSQLAAEALVELGYTNIKEFGGILDWPYEVE